MLKCKNCGKDYELGGVGDLIAYTYANRRAWLYCIPCVDGEYMNIPSYIPRKQVERFIDAKV